MRSICHIIPILIVLLAFAEIISPCSAIRDPYPTDQASRPDLQNMIEMAASGSIIELEDGTYQGTVIINRPLTLTAAGDQGDQSVVIDAMGNSSGIIVAADGVVVKGLQVINASGSGILLQADSCRLTGNLLVRNGIGISLQEADNNALQNNTAAENGIGLYLNSSSRNIIQDNIIAQSDTGLALVESSSNLIRSNRIISSGLGIDLYQCRINTISGNDISENQQSARDDSGNRWSYRRVGNYYGPCADADRDGLCDLPVAIAGGRAEDSSSISQPPLGAAQYAPQLPADLSTATKVPVQAGWGEVGQSFDQMLGREGWVSETSGSPPIARRFSPSPGLPDLPLSFEPGLDEHNDGIDSSWEDHQDWPKYPGPSAPHSQAERLTLLDHGMAKGIEPSGQPVGRTSSFSATDSYAYSWVSFGPVYQPHALDWRWYSPSGALHSTSSGAIPHPGKSGLAHWYSPKYWSELAIQGRAPSSMPGTWRVQFLVDGQLMAEERFIIY